MESCPQGVPGHETESHRVDPSRRNRLQQLPLAVHFFHLFRSVFLFRPIRYDAPSGPKNGIGAPGNNSWV
jgi:hypothetical protein